MSLMSIMFKDIRMLVGMVIGHYIHKKFIQFKIDLMGKTRSRVAQMRTLLNREHYLIRALQDSISSMQEYRAIMKAGYDPYKY